MTYQKVKNSFPSPFPHLWIPLIKLISKPEDILKCELDDSRIFSLSLCMREGLTNAIKHGHQLDSEKIAHYTLTIKEKKIIIEIEDQGEGFNWKEISKKNQTPSWTMAAD